MFVSAGPRPSRSAARARAHLPRPSPTRARARARPCPPALVPALVHALVPTDARARARALPACARARVCPLVGCICSTRLARAQSRADATNRGRSHTHSPARGSLCTPLSLHLSAAPFARPPVCTQCWIDALTHSPDSQLWQGVLG
eukprot:scaffold1650_cov60-Phaeocystis_antarctica.AAC.1